MDGARKQRDQHGASVPHCSDTVSDYPSATLQLVLDLSDAERRESSLLELSKQREDIPDLGPLLWYSFGTMAALLQEVVTVYPLLSPPRLTPALSNRCCNALALLQSVACHRDVRAAFICGELSSTAELQPFLLSSKHSSVCVPLSQHRVQCPALRISATDKPRRGWCTGQGS